MRCLNLGRYSLLHSYTILVALLFVSFGFTSAYADETFVDPDSFSFGYVPQSSLPKHVPVVTDPLTGEEPNIDQSKNYILYPAQQAAIIESDEKQLINIDGQQFYLVPDPLVADTDADGLSDGAEVNTHGTDPLVADTDSGGVNDGDEIINGLDPLKRNDDRLLL